MAALMPRRRINRILATCSLGATAALLLAASAAAKPRVTGTFPVPGVGTNNKIVAGPDGNMWVTVSSGKNDVARITPAGKVDEFELEGVEGAVGIARSPGKSATIMWVTYSKGVASFDVGDPKGTSKATELAGFSGAEAIVAGPDKQMWVAAKDEVLHFPPANPAAPTKLPVPGLMPKDIDVAGKKIVVAETGSGRIVTFTAAGVQKDIKTAGGSQGLAGSSGGQIAFSEPAAMPEQIGLFTPPKKVKSFKFVADPFGVARGADHAFWVVLFTPGGLERVARDGSHRTAVRGLPKESARQIASGPKNTLWVTLTANEKEAVARVSGVVAPKRKR